MNTPTTATKPSGKMRKIWMLGSFELKLPILTHFPLHHNATGFAVSKILLDLFAQYTLCPKK